MITAIIIDDEINKANYLKSMLEKSTPSVILKGIATSAEEGIKLILNEQPQLVFLDIELQTSTGFDLLNKLNNLNFSVIFTTAHQNYALKAIKFAALDFLLKPVDEDELKVAVNKAIKTLNNATVNKNIEVLISNLNQKNNQKKIAISTNSGIIVIDIVNILYCKSDGPYTLIFSNDNKIVSSTHLKEFENLLTEFGFFRIHKSYLVNLNEIKMYKKSDAPHLIVSNGDRVNVSDKKKEELIIKLSSEVIFVH